MQTFSQRMKHFIFFQSAMIMFMHPDSHEKVRTLAVLKRGTFSDQGSERNGRIAARAPKENEAR